MEDRKCWSFNVHLHDIGIDDNGYSTQDDLRKALNQGLDQAEQVFRAISDLGGSYVRTDFSWKLVQPHPEEFDSHVLNFFRTYADLADRYGIQVICVLYQVPHWAKRAHEADPKWFYDVFKLYCREIAWAMEGRIKYYQLWNDPNNILTFLRDDNFAIYYDFPALFAKGEEGLREGGYEYEIMLNFAINVLTELEAVSFAVNYIVGPVIDALASIRDFRILDKINLPGLLGPLGDWIKNNLIPQELIHKVEQAITDMQKMKHLFEICFSWKTAMNYFLVQNHFQNRDNRINIYGIDHYPGTWTARSYEDWSVLGDAAGIVRPFGKDTAIIQTGFATWGGAGGYTPVMEQVEEAAIGLTMEIAQFFIDVFRSILNTVLGSSPQIIKDVVNNVIPADQMMRETFRVVVNPAVVQALKSVYLNDHTYSEQALWVKKSLDGLYANELWKNQRFINWYELRDANSENTVKPTNITRFLYIVEDHFGIMHTDFTPKDAYGHLKGKIQLFRETI